MIMSYLKKHTFDQQRWLGTGLLLLFFALMGPFQPSALASPTGWEMSRIITGKVVDENGEPLIGATVLVKGTQDGTITDVDGSFQLDVPDGAVLVFSFTGYESVELAATPGMQVVMKPTSQVLEQVVVIGYGTERRKAATGAVARVGGEELSKQPLLTATQALQGLATGIQVIGSGQPGSQPRVQIRGVNTVLTNENPLYVVDGVLTSDITNINTADIVSVDVLKDGAAAIYGSRAANGVVLITTKRGQSGKPVVSFDAQYGYRSLINRVDMADAEFYATYTNEARAYDGQVPLFDLDTLFYDTDWFDKITQNGALRNYNLSVSGGTDNLNYLFSGGYFGDEGVLKGAEFSRISFRSNNEYKPFEWFKIGNVLNVTATDNSPMPTGAFTDAYRIGPTAPVRYPNDSYGYVNGLSVGNPVAALDLTNENNKGQRIQGSLYGEVTLLEGLKFRSSWGFDRNNGNSLGYTPVYKYGIYNNPQSELRIGENRSNYWVWDNVLSLVQGFGANDDHIVRLTLGTTAERDRGRYVNVRVTDVPADENLWYVTQGDPNSVVTTDGGYLARRQSYFGRINYSFRDKYNLSGILRRDGSSAFPADQKWGTFYAVGASWVISDEEFMANVSLFDYLKLRGGYSEMGNDGISRIVNNELSQLISFSITNPYGYPDGLGVGITYDQVKDAFATWETTNTIDFGLEFGLLDRQLTGEIAYYNKLTNAYIRVPTPSFVDVDGILSPAADVRNKGIEASLKWSKSISSDFSYHFGVNATFNQNEVEEVRGGIDLKDGGLGNGEVTTSTVEGEPIGSFWVYQTDGIYQTQSEIDASPNFAGTIPGDFRYVDTNGDGDIDARDRVYVGSYQPKAFFGAQLGINWKQFDLNIDCYGNAGNKVYNGKKGVRFGNDNIEVAREDRWTPSNTNTDEPRASNNIPKPSTYFVESGNFFRINNISLGYTVSQAVSSKLKMASARVYVAAQNPLVAKKFSGFTPELPGSSALNSGIELGIYPTLATYMVGVNVTFE